MPSKALLRSAQVRRLSAMAHVFGATAGPLALDDRLAGFRAAVARRDRISEGRDDSNNAAKLVRSGATLYRGVGRIAGQGRVSVALAGGRRAEISCDELVIATGSRPSWPSIPGLDEVPTWTSDEALSSDELPARMVVLGGGPVGCELAQVYATFGTEVSLVQSESHLLADEEPFLGQILAGVLVRQGIDLRLDTAAESATRAGGRATIELSDRSVVEADRVLLATGRTPG
jgi:pyruvate/2-oxoglutarate dehydrogenase complex dihydrolipoamide dehydrogenase (E3) component